MEGREGAGMRQRWGEGGELDEIRGHFTWFCASVSFPLSSVSVVLDEWLRPGEAQSSHLYSEDCSTDCLEDPGAG